MFFVVSFLVGLAIGAIAVWLARSAQIEVAKRQAAGESQIEIAKLEERMSNANAELEYARTVVAELKTKVAQDQSQISTAQSECAQLAERASRVPELEQEVQLLQDKVQSEVAQAAKLEQQCLRMPALEQGLQTVTEDNKRLTQEIAQLRADLGASTSTLGGERKRIISLEDERTQLVAQCNQLTGEQRALAAKVAELTTSLAKDQEHADERVRLIKGAKEEFSATFQSLADKILEEKAAKLNVENTQSISGVLNPLREKLTEFQSRVEQVHTEQTRDRAALGEQVKQLTTLNRQLSDDAQNLANALKGSGKTQGNWGEMILERMLEFCGLCKGRDYELRPTHETGEGKRAQPDVVINLPGDRHFVVDSKVSLTDYEQYVKEEDQTAQAAALVRHIGSMREHVKELSEKDYQKLHTLNSLDFVTMFVPIESAFAVAILQDSTLWEEAWNRNVLIVSPSTLLFVLRTVAYLWRQEDLVRNVREIATRGGELYDKLVGFVEDLDDLGKRLRQAKDSFESAYRKLSTGRGNLIQRAEGLREMGVKPSKSLPPELVEGAIDDSMVLPSLAAAAGAGDGAANEKPFDPSSS